jgi:hypothetical protein
MDYANKNYLKSTPEPEPKGWGILAAVLWALVIVLFNFV